MIHLVHEGADLLDRELADALLEHLFFFGQHRQRGAGRGFDCGGHRGSLRRVGCSGANHI
jgi:hypothetical protein